MLAILLIILMLFITALLVGLLISKGVLVKLLFLNSMTSVAALFICALGSFYFNDSYIDIALIYFLLSFIASIAYLNYIKTDAN